MRLFWFMATRSLVHRGPGPGFIRTSRPQAHEVPYVAYLSLYSYCGMWIAFITRPTADSSLTPAITHPQLSFAPWPHCVYHYTAPKPPSISKHSITFLDPGPHGPETGALWIHDLMDLGPCGRIPIIPASYQSFPQSYSPILFLSSFLVWCVSLNSILACDFHDIIWTFTS